MLLCRRAFSNRFVISISTRLESPFNSASNKEVSTRMPWSSATCLRAETTRSTMSRRSIRSQRSTPCSLVANVSSPVTRRSCNSTPRRVRRGDRSVRWARRSCLTRVSGSDATQHHNVRARGLSVRVSKLRTSLVYERRNRDGRNRWCRPAPSSADPSRRRGSRAHCGSGSRTGEFDACPRHFGSRQRHGLLRYRRTACLLRARRRRGTSGRPFAPSGHLACAREAVTILSRGRLSR